jgi:hypothetical protein
MKPEALEKYVLLSSAVQRRWPSWKETKKVKKLSIALLILVAVLTLSSISLMVSVRANQQDQSNFSAQLGGDQEVPPRTTNATGQATFQLRDETQLDFTLNLVNLKNLVAAHIHCAPAGENGPVGVTLFGPVTPGGGVGGYNLDSRGDNGS